MRTRRYGDISLLGLFVLMAVIWGLFFVFMGLLARSAYWLFCVGFGCN